METYQQLREQRDAIEEKMRELERTTLQEIEDKARSFGFALTAATAEPKQRRKRRTRAEIEAANAGTTA